MTWAGPKSARSKVGKAVGEPSQTNLDANNQLGHSLFCDDLPYQCRNTLEAVLVELRIARILADLAHHVD